MARQSSGRRNPEDVAADEALTPADSPEKAEFDADADADAEAGHDDDSGAEDDLDEDEDAGDEDEDAEAEDEDAEAAADAERSDETQAFWESVRVDVLEVALPRGVGYTLRAYRPETEVTPTDISEREADEFPERNRPARAFVEDEKAILDDFEDEDEETPAPARGRHARAADPDEDDEDADDLAEDDEAEDEDEDDAEDETGEDDGDDEQEEAAAAADEPEEVPVFLGRAGKLYLFRSPEGLVEFVRSGAEHDLSQLATWSDVVERISVADVVPLPEDRYELDLVVENLRGGYDAWDPELLIQAGEIARDLGYALRLEQAMAALAPGSPLDDLDEVMRTAAGGGFSGFFARRKLKKIGAEAAPLGWRTIIGKISAAVDWRD
ncbi:MAG TPA: DNA primase [Rugosimonospora sp.]|nr:DNA primase [Rugosimonospora sp.]